MTFDDFAYSATVDRLATRFCRMIPKRIRYKIACAISDRTRWCWSSLGSWGLYGEWESLRNAWESRCWHNVPQGGCWCGKFREEGGR